MFSALFVIIFSSQHILFLPIYSFLFILLSSAGILGHLLIFKSGAHKSDNWKGLDWGSSLEDVLARSLVRKLLVPVSGSFLLVWSGSPEKSILISCQNSTAFAASFLKKKTEEEKRPGGILSQTRCPQLRDILFHHLWRLSSLQYFARMGKEIWISNCLFFCLFRATMEVPRLGRGWIGAEAAGLCHSHARSKPHLRLQPQLTAMLDL